MQKIRSLFQADVTRDIPPVVYFHEQSPAALQAEVSEYVVTGGFPETDPRHRRIGQGIHECLVQQLTNIARELDKPTGPDLPACWISGFFGSGKTSYAKLLGLGMAGVQLPNGQTLAQALLDRDDSPKAAELTRAWEALAQRFRNPVAVVFDIGAAAHADEHIHAAILRKVREKLGYCRESALVAEFELRLELDGRWPEFLAKAPQVLGKPWAEASREKLAEDHFSHVLHVLDPERYRDPMAWVDARAGSSLHQAVSAEEAVAAIEAMMTLRAEGRHLLLIVDEVSQYIHENEGRMLGLQSFVSELGQKLHGLVWLFVTGQQKLDDEGGSKTVAKLKDRFPPRLRAHLAPTNIRDVVHRRLLRKKPEVEAALKDLFQRHRPELKTCAFGCESVTAEDFVEVYPLLPGHVDLLLQITSNLRSRSTRIQGDDQAIRGLLQLLGEIFRARGLADRDVGEVVNLEDVYEVMQSALDADTQATLGRIASWAASTDDELAARCAKAVALLELIQEQTATTATLVAQSLYRRLGDGSHEREVRDALERLRDANHLGYTEKQGYRIQSSAGQEWERERSSFDATGDQVSGQIRKAFEDLFAKAERPKIDGRPLPWQGTWHDERGTEARLLDARGEAAAYVSVREVRLEERRPELWARSTTEKALENEIVWVVGDTGALVDIAREVLRSSGMLLRYEPRQASLPRERQRLLLEERGRVEDLEARLVQTVAQAWMSGRIYFRGRELKPGDHAPNFWGAIQVVANRVLPEVYPHFTGLAITEHELRQLLETELSGLSTKFGKQQLGIVEFEGGRYAVTATGPVPTRVGEFIEQSGGTTGATLLTYFAKPPFGYAVDVVRACVLGLVRAGRIRIRTEGGSDITSVKDPDTKTFFSRDRDLRVAELYPIKSDAVDPKTRVLICKLFEEALGDRLDRDNDTIADAVFRHFPPRRERLRVVEARVQTLPGRPALPSELKKLAAALEECCRDRHVLPTVQAVARRLDTLRDGLQLLAMFETELTEDAVRRVAAAGEVREHQLAQLLAVGQGAELAGAAGAVERQLALERPWREVGSLDSHLAAIREAYRVVRRSFLAQQGEACERERAAIKRRDGFDKLKGDEQHSVLRPIALAGFDTAEDAIAPSLEQLRDQFPGRLHAAVERANELLDELLVGKEITVTTVRLNLQHVEIASEAQLDGYLEDLRKRVVERLRKGERVRLV
jgi:hypothetical protein